MRASKKLLLILFLATWGGVFACVFPKRGEAPPRVTREAEPLSAIPFDSDEDQGVPADGDIDPLLKKEIVLHQRKVKALENALSNRRPPRFQEDPADGQIIEIGPNPETLWIDLGRLDKLTRGTKFKVWRVGKGGVRHDIAMVRVFDIHDLVSECEVLEEINPIFPVAKGQSVSNPFYDSREPLTIHIYGDLTFCDTNVAVLGLQDAGMNVSRHLDKSVDVIVLGEPPAASGASAKVRSMTRDAQLDRVLEEARSIGATVVSEHVLRSFMDH